MDYNGSDLYGSGFDDDNCALEQVPNITLAVFMILIVIVGLFGNAVVFFVIIVLKEYKKSVSNWYVLQLALADTLFLLMLPFSASNELAGKWEFSEPLCKAKEGIIFVNYYASILFLTIMSFDRYMAVTKSGVSKWTDALRRLDSAALISLLAWIVSICFCIPLFLYSRLNNCSRCEYEFPQTDAEKCQSYGIDPRNETECQRHINGDGTDDKLSDFLDKYPQYFANFSGFSMTIGNITKRNEDICKDTYTYTYTTWLYLNFSLMLVLPLVLICTFYGMILRTMMGTASIASTSQRQYRRRVTLMVLALVSLFAIAWLPWYSVKLAKIQGFELSKVGCTRLENFTRIFSYLNSALNPYFYSFMGSRFHQRFLKARNTATRKSTLLSFISRMSWHPGHDSNNSTSGGGSVKNPRNGNDIRMRSVNGFSDDESFNTKTNLRTERTLVDAQ